MIKYNVIIVGAGPAGSFLAYKLRNQGISVFFWIKRLFQGIKPVQVGFQRKPMIYYYQKI